MNSTNAEAIRKELVKIRKQLQVNLQYADQTFGADKTTDGRIFRKGFGATLEILQTHVEDSVKLIEQALEREETNVA